jgi:topoisomerase IV subunit A
MADIEQLDSADEQGATTVDDEFGEQEDEVIEVSDSGSGGFGGVISLEEYDSSGGSVGISAFAKRAYMAYAMSVVKGRALPCIEDGQKPVQTRILFAMKELGNWSNASFKKSARIVGDVIGKYHPHGDSSVYEAAVRMTQDFTLRYPLIEGQGNFGSRDGDGAAAMRYTEIRVSKFAEDILIKDMDRGTVDFKDNYDGSMVEPSMMPARLPVMLLNGVMGIAVGMATDIPPHNLKEVCDACCEILEARNKGEHLSDSRILDLIKGPDFPGGAQIISLPADIEKVYLTGRGSLRTRARWTIENLARGQWQIVIHELPPCSFDGKEIGDRKVTGTARILAEIDEMLSPKFEKGKKALSPKQLSLKASLSGLLDKARDDSDEKHPIRIILEPKSAKVSPDDLMGLLLANTALEGNYKVNMVCLGRDGRPLQKSVPEILHEWIGFRLDVTLRRLKFRYDEVLKRLHILEGRMIAFLNIDKVIKVIRESDSPKEDLIKAFNLSEVQAEDILEIRLRQLARLEGIKIEQEIAKLMEEKAQIEHLLSNENAMRKLVSDEISSDASKFGDNRRTLIEHSEKVTLSKVEMVVDEPITVIVSANGFVRSRTGHGVDESSLTWKAGDSKRCIIETRSTHPIIVLDGNGRSYSFKSIDVPGGKGDGVPITSLIELQGSKIKHILSAGMDEKVFVCSTGCYGYVCKVSDMVSKQKAGKRFMTLSESEEMLKPMFVRDNDKIFCVSSSFKGLSFPVSEIKELDGGKGVIIMGLGDDEKMIHCKLYKDSVTIKGKVKSGKEMEFTISSKNDEKWAGKRARKGSGFPVQFVSVKEVA